MHISQDLLNIDYPSWIWIPPCKLFLSKNNAYNS